MKPLAQIPTPSGDDFLKWILGALGALAGLKIVLSCVESVKKLFGPKKADEVYATKAEVETAIGSCALKSEITVMQTNLDKLDTYVHTSFHDLRNDLNPLAIDMATIKAFQQTQEKQIAALTAKGEASHTVLLEVRQILQDKRTA